MCLQADRSGSSKTPQSVKPETKTLKRKLFSPGGGTSEDEAGKPPLLVNVFITISKIMGKLALGLQWLLVGGHIVLLKVKSLLTCSTSIHHFNCYRYIFYHICEMHNKNVFPVPMKNTVYIFCVFFFWRL